MIRCVEGTCPEKSFKVLRYRAVKIRALMVMAVILVSVASYMPHNTFIPQGNNTPSVSGYTYNFSEMRVGSRPENSSWIGFTVHGRVNYSVEESQYGVGLNVNTGSIRSGSFLESVMDVPAGYSICINFSWNDSQDGAYTGDTISLEDNGSMSVMFGPLYGFETRMEMNGTVISRSGEMPFGIDSLREFQSYTGNDTGFIQMDEKGSVLPPVSFGNMVMSGTVTMFIGGDISNITVYEISLIHETVFPELMKSRHLDSENYSVSGIPEYGMVTNESEFMPQTNSVLIPYENGSVYSYNYANRTGFPVVLPPDDPENFTFVESLDAGSSAYFIFSGISGTIVDRVDSGMKVMTEEYASSVNYSYVIGIAGKGLIAMSQYGAIELNSSGSMTQLKESAYVQSMKIISAHSGTDGISAILEGDGKTVEASSSAGRITLQNISSYSQGFWNGSSVISRSVSDGSVSSIIRFTGYGKPYYMYVSPCCRYFSGSGGLSWVTGGNLLYEKGYMMSTNGTLYVTGVNSTVNIIAAGDGIQEWVSIGKGIIKVLMPQGIPAVQGMIRVSFPRVVIVENTTGITYSVNSSSAYIASLKFFGRTFRSVSQHMEVRAEGIPNGNYSAEFSVANDQGITYSESVTVKVDNYWPGFTSTAANGSFLSNGSVVRYSVNDPWMVSGITVTCLGITESIGTSGNFTLISGTFNGASWLNFSILDIFGRYYNYSYHVRIIGLSRKNFTTSLVSGYTSSSIMNISWSSLSWAKFYSVSDSGKIFETENDSLTMVLQEGENRISISAFSVSGINVSLANATVIRIGYDPALYVQHSTDSYYSFWGNSENNSYTISGMANITSSISVSVFLNGESKAVYLFNNSFNLTFSSHSGIFTVNGNYQIQVLAVSLSGTRSIYTTILRVNNTIPASPDIPARIYINSSTVAFSIPRGERYDINLSGNGTQRENLSSEGSTISFQLPEMNATYSVMVTAISASGNHKSAESMVYSYNAEPGISVSLSSIRLIMSPFLNVSYRISDKVPVKSVLLIMNGEVASRSLMANGTFNVKVQVDGNYQISLFVTDMCGNRNSSEAISFSNLYYSSVTGGSIAAVQGITGWELYADLSGHLTPEIQVRWYVDGHYAGEGYSIGADLPLGKTNLTIMVTSDGNTYFFSRIVINSGYVVAVAAISAALSYILAVSILGIRDENRATEAILRSGGKSLREARKTAVREGINRLVWKRALNSLRSGNKIILEKDLDGKKFIMPGPDSSEITRGGRHS